MAARLWSRSRSTEEQHLTQLHGPLRRRPRRMLLSSTVPLPGIWAGAIQIRAVPLPSIWVRAKGALVELASLLSTARFLLSTARFLLSTARGWPRPLVILVPRIPTAPMERQLARRGCWAVLISSRGCWAVLISRRGYLISRRGCWAALISRRGYIISRRGCLAALVGGDAHPHQRFSHSHSC
jgi:hypothetical protein